MAYDTLIDPPAYFQPREVANLGFVHGDVPELKRVELTGRVAEWAEYQKLTRGETVTAHSVFKVRQGKQEDVIAWIRRTGVVSLADNVEEYDYSQLVCNHAAETDDEADFETALMACDAVAKVIESRVYLIRERLQNRQILDEHKQESLIVGKSARKVVKDMALFVLRREQIHPHSWYANFISGQHTLHGLSSIFEMDPTYMKQAVLHLVGDGKVDLHHDEVITLKTAA